MKTQIYFRATLVLTLVGAAALLGGCGGAADLVQTETISENEMLSGAQVGSMAGPSADVAGSMIVGMLGSIQPGVTPMVGGNTQAVVTGSSCESTFDLGNGVTGTCTIDEQGVVTWTFSGMIDVDGESVTVEGSMTATPAVNQPQTGSRYDLMYNATASGPRGTATWNTTGTIALDEIGVVTGYTLTMIQNITPTGGATVVVTTTITPGALDMSFAGPLGGTMTLSIDRQTMSGTLSLNGLQVATLTFADGCVTINSSIPVIPSQEVCPEA